MWSVERLDNCGRWESQTSRSDFSANRRALLSLCNNQTLADHMKVNGQWLSCVRHEGEKIGIVQWSTPTIAVEEEI